MDPREPSTEAADVAGLFGRVYGELRRMARRQLASQASEWTLNPTALVHEVYLKLSSAEPSLTDRRHLMALAARAMRQIVVDHARRKRRLKRGGVERAVRLDPVEPGVVDLAAQAQDVLLVDQALRSLAEADPRLERVVELRFFGGLSVEETAAAVEASPRSVKRDWAMAQAWLYRRLEADS